MFVRLRFPGAFFFATSAFGLLQLYYAIGRDLWRLSLGALTYGLALGTIVQLFVVQPVPKTRAGIASFAAAFTLWLPVFLVTYGLALVGSAVLAAYGTTVVLGTYFGALLRNAQRTRSAP